LHGRLHQKEGTILCGAQKIVPEKENLDGFFDQILELRFAHGSGNLIDNFTAFKKNERRDGANPEFSGGSGVVVHIHFSDNDFAFKFGCKLVNNRTDSLTWATPWRPKINQAGKLVSNNLGIEFTVRYVHYIVTCHLYLSF